jgi:hypothetical protein
MSKVRKAAIIVDENGIRRHATIDVIEYEGTFWLVPEWLDNHRQRVSKPARIVCLQGLEHQQRRRGVTPEFVVNNPVPRWLLDGPIPPEEADKYVVLDYPEIQFPILPRIQ